MKPDLAGKEDPRALLIQDLTNHLEQQMAKVLFDNMTRFREVGLSFQDWSSAAISMLMITSFHLLRRHTTMPDKQIVKMVSKALRTMEPRE